MFPTKAKPASVPSGNAGAPSILSPDLQVTGNIVTSGEVHVSGTVKGDIIAKKVTISEGASVSHPEKRQRGRLGHGNRRIDQDTQCAECTARCGDRHGLESPPEWG